MNTIICDSTEKMIEVILELQCLNIKFRVEQAAINTVNGWLITLR